MTAVLLRGGAGWRTSWRWSASPTFPPVARFSGATVLLFPVILTYGALALPFAGTLALAFCNGLLWDALTVQIVQLDPYVQQAGGGGNAPRLVHPALRPAGGDDPRPAPAFPAWPLGFALPRQRLLHGRHPGGAVRGDHLLARRADPPRAIIILLPHVLLPRFFAAARSSWWPCSASRAGRAPFTCYQTPSPRMTYKNPPGWR